MSGVALLAAGLAVGVTAAASVKRWSVSTGRALATGTLDGTAIDAEGQVRLAPGVRALWGPDAGIVWSVAADDEAAVVGLSGPGRVLRVTADGNVETLLELGDESLVTAVAAARKRGAWVGRSPDGEILYVARPGEVQSRGTTGAKFVWALTTDDDGELWIGTGVPGQVLRNPDAGVMVEVLATGDDPVRCLARFPGGGVVAGTGGRGRVIRVDPRARPFVLYDADEQEIVSVAVDADGTVFALAAGGPKQVRGVATTPRTADNTVTVTAPAPPGDDPPGREGDDDERPQDDRPAVTGAAGGALYRIDPDGAVRSIWATQTELPFAVALGPAPDGGPATVLVATGDQGRVHRMDREGRRGSVQRIAADQASALAVTAAGRIWVGGSTDARVETIEPQVRDTGTYTSAPIDAGTVAAWGRLDWRATTPDGAAVTFGMRAGNTAEPDETWTEWMELDGNGHGVAARVPPTRHAQMRATLTAGRGGTPVLHELALSYLPRNRPPIVERFEIGTAGVVWSLGPAPSNVGRGPVVADDPVARAAAEALANTRRNQAPIRRSYEQGARTFAWNADDPDGDRLTFSLEIRRAEAERWLPLADAIDAGFYSWDARAMPDGAYRARLVASDHLDNPAGQSLEHESISEVFWVDNSRPRVENFAFRDGTVAFDAVDDEGRVVAVEIAWDGGPWQAVDPTDGVADSARETYRIAAEPGRSAVMLRVVDAAGNLGGEARALD